MKTFDAAFRLLIVIGCYVGLFYSLYQASAHVNANEYVKAVRYDVLAVFFIVYICWMDVVHRLKRIEEKQDALNVKT